ncbi:5'-methylthioadenosine nucleosidase [Mesomycoplasma conjunctivae]|uniref:phosphorylase family protein n=1 Tax=Mesomycoplasma conjunctivae TaxID=45361 RepID=UPI003DA27063
MKSIVKNKNIAIIYADNLEKVNLDFLEIQKSVQKQTPFGKIECLELPNFNIFYANSGIGLNNAAALTQHLIDKYQVEIIYNYGAVGSVNNIEIGTIIYPKKFFLLDAITPWYQAGVTPGELPYLKNNILNKENGDIILGSSNSFIDNIEKLKIFPQVKFVEMEAFAIAFICQKNQVKFACIKYVSDIIGSNSDFEIVNNAIKKGAKKALEKIFKYLKNQ